MVDEDLRIRHDLLGRPVEAGHATSSVDVAIVGGGITGLGAAHALRAGDPTLRITVFEGAPAVGGKLRTIDFAGQRIDTGPDGFVVRGDAVTTLCEQLGLDTDLVSPCGGAPGIVYDGRLRRIPPGIMGGLATRPLSVARSGMLPWHGLLRAALDVVAPSHAPDRDVSVGSLVRRRLGDATADRIVQPLLGGIHCADIDAMSARMCAPQLLAALATGRGLVRGARATKTAGPPPRFLTLRGGMSRLVDGLVAAMPDVRLRTDDAVVGVLPHRHGWEVVGRRTSVHARALIVCAPPRDAAALLDHVRDTVAHNLGRIESTSVGIVLLTYGRNSFDEVPQSSGFIVSPQERTLLTACTWVSAKWPHLGTGEHVIARCSTGRSGDARAAALDDAELIDRVDGELRRLAGIRGGAVQARVVRWTHSMPQFRPGHGRLVEAVRETLPSSIVLAGAGYDGTGIHACIEHGRSAATSVLEQLQEATKMAESA